MCQGEKNSLKYPEGDVRGQSWQRWQVLKSTCFELNIIFNGLLTLENVQFFLRFSEETSLKVLVYLLIVVYDF